LKYFLNNMSIKEFGLKLKNARQQKSLSQRGLGLALGLSDKTISSYESSRSYPNLDLLLRISEILDKPVEYFISSSKEILIKEELKRIEIKQEEIIKDIKKIFRIIK